MAMVMQFGSLLVLPIGVFRMFQVPQRPAAVDGRDFFEVVRRRRRGGRPFQRPGVPRIVARRLAVPQRDDQVVDEDRVARHLDERADRAELIPNLPAAAGVVGVDPPRHAEHAGDVHRPERQDEADEQQPELPPGEPLREHPAGHLGIPVVDARRTCRTACRRSAPSGNGRRRSSCRTAESRTGRRRA